MSKLKYVHSDPEYIKAAETGLIEYLSNLWATIDYEEDNPPLEEESNLVNITLTGEYFCGCDTCVTRETFAYLLPLIIDGYKENKFELNEEYTA